MSESITVRLSRETLDAADRNRKRFGFSNRSEFIDAAIREYISRDLLKEFSGELVKLYGKIEHSEIKHMEDRLAKLSYKIAVELGQLNLFLASALGLNIRDVNSLRGKAVALIRQSNGYLTLPVAAKNKLQLEWLEEENA